MPESADIRTNLRLAPELYDKVKELANKDHRSINGEMIVLLQEAVKAREVKKESELGNSLVLGVESVDFAYA